MDVVAIGAALGLALVLGISSAPNAASALVASRTAPWRVALGYSFVLHALGALLGEAVALTIAGLVAVPDDEVAAVYASGCVATIAFVAVAARLGLPTSATHGMIGGLARAGLAAGGVHAVNWGGFDGIHPVGVVGALAVLVLSPVVGLAAGLVSPDASPDARLARHQAHARAGARGESGSPPARSCSPTGRTTTEGDGRRRDDGLLATGAGIDTFEIPPSVRWSVALVFALGTVVGGGRVVRRVGRGYFRPTPVDSLASQTSAAAVDPRFDRRRCARSAPPRSSPPPSSASAPTATRATCAGRVSRTRSRRGS